MPYFLRFRSFDSDASALRRLPFQRRLACAAFAVVHSLGCSAGSDGARPPNTQGETILASPAEQARMQAYAEGLYDARDVRTSFHNGSQSVDCIEFSKQPGCRQDPEACRNVTPPPPVEAPPPAGPPPGYTGPLVAVQPATPVNAGASCPTGTVPILRPQLENMRHFRTLEDYLRGGKVAPPGS